MTTFEWSILILVLVGVVLPVWAFFVAAFIAAKSPRRLEPSARFFAYAKVIQSLHNQMDEESGTVDLGPLWAATLRELREYPEFADLTLLYLEEIDITGSKKFDHVMRNELKAVEARLLSAGDASVGTSAQRANGMS